MSTRQVGPARIFKHCIFLGREKGGVYRGQLNFFGGKVNRGEPPMKALIREVAEEMCVKLTPEVLERCILSAELLPRLSRNGHEHCTLLVVVHISGITCGAWSSVAQERKRQRAPGCLREMSEVSHVPVEDYCQGRMCHLMFHRMFRLSARPFAG